VWLLLFKTGLLEKGNIRLAVVLLSDEMPEYATFQYRISIFTILNDLTDGNLIV
jgi:hypothetical protein